LFDQNQTVLSNTNNYQTEIDTSHWLKATRGIRDILEDNKGNLWFSSPDYVAKFDGKKLYYFSKKDGLSITGNLHEDSNGTVWIENGFRIFRYNGERFFEEKIDNISSSNGLWIQRGLNPTDSTFVEPGLYEVNEKNTVFHPLPIKEHIENKFLHLPSTKAIFGKDSTVWIGTMEQVYGFKKDFVFVIGREEMGRQHDQRQMGIRGIFVDSKGKLWMADNGAGVFVFDGKETKNFTKKHKLDEKKGRSNTLHRSFSIAEDAEGNMWFGTVYSGVWRYKPQTEEFENYTATDGIKSDNIWTIYKTKKGELLFAGETPAGVYRFNGKNFDRIF
jgi:ligand-binding sensor domain-containing protein